MNLRTIIGLCALSLVGPSDVLAQSGSIDLESKMPPVAPPARIRIPGGAIPSTIAAPIPPPPPAPIPAGIGATTTESTTKSTAYPSLTAGDIADIHTLCLNSGSWISYGVCKKFRYVNRK